MCVCMAVFESAPLCVCLCMYVCVQVINDLEASKYQLTEWRISIYGRKASEWASLARWFYVNRLAHSNVRW